MLSFLKRYPFTAGYVGACIFGQLVFAICKVAGIIPYPWLVVAAPSITLICYVLVMFIRYSIFTIFKEVLN